MTGDIDLLERFRSPCIICEENSDFSLTLAGWLLVGCRFQLLENMQDWDRGGSIERGPRGANRRSLTLLERCQTKQRLFFDPGSSSVVDSNFWKICRGGLNRTGDKGRHFTPHTSLCVTSDHPSIRPPSARGAAHKGCSRYLGDFFSLHLQLIPIHAMSHIHAWDKGCGNL